jgi:cupin fold WbuC family metalloprotein
MKYFLTKTQLDELCQVAQDSPRLRKNLNIHSTEAHPCQRLFNAMQTSSYIRPHRHSAELKDETLIMVQGKLGVVIFSETGEVLDKTIVSVGGTHFGYHLPAGIFHTVVALEPNTVFFEAKAGPYTPTQASEFADWAPAEGTPDAADYLHKMTTLFA